MHQDHGSVGDCCASYLLRCSMVVRETFGEEREMTAHLQTGSKELEGSRISSTLGPEAIQQIRFQRPNERIPRDEDHRRPYAPHPALKALALTLIGCSTLLPFDAACANADEGAANRIHYGSWIQRCARTYGLILQTAADPSAVPPVIVAPNQRQVLTIDGVSIIDTLPVGFSAKVERLLDDQEDVGNTVLIRPGIPVKIGPLTFDHERSLYVANYGDLIRIKRNGRLESDSRIRPLFRKIDVKPTDVSVERFYDFGDFFQSALLRGGEQGTLVLCSNETTQRRTL